MPTYKCECCNFNTLLKSNFMNHLKTNKHIGNSQHKVNPKSTFVENSQPKVNPESTSLFSCKYCEQKFKFKQSMYRHIKYTCTKNKEEDLTELVRLMNNQLINQNNQILFLMNKIENS